MARPSPNSSFRAVFGFALAGLRAAWTTERNLRIHSLLAVAAFAAAAVLRPAPLGWALIVGAVVFVLTAELLNSALESVVDLASPELHPLARRAKDIAAGAVLVAAAGAVAIGALVAVDTLRGR